MSSLIVNVKTEQNIERFISSPTHALLFYGQNGLGVGTIALDTAKQLAGNQILLIKSDESKKINIETIRDDVIKVITNRQKDRLAIVINDADLMTIGAQNSLLKVLEEPNDNVHFILSTHNIDKLLPTIRSRIQMIEIMPVAASETDKMLEKVKITADKRQKIIFLASGKPAEIKRLLDDELYYRSMASIAENAKKFISGDTYERLKIVSGIKKRDEAIDFVRIISNLILFLIKNREIPHVSDNLEIISSIIDNLYRNGNVRAQMTYLATNYI